MKKVATMLLALCVLALAPASAETAGNALGFELLRALGGGAENCVLSPVSAAYALAMAAEGARGETREELLGALGVDDPEAVGALAEALEAAGLKLANAAFATGGAAISEDYAAALADAFGAEWFDVGDDLAGRINAWVAEQTGGLIERLLDEPPADDVALALVNAAAMEAKWQSPFLPEATEDGTFRAPDGDVTVPMMHQTLSAPYGERDGVQLLRLGYVDSGLELLIALPGEEAGVGDVLDGLCTEGMDYFRFDEADARVALTMPKLDLSADSSLVAALRSLGVETPFGDAADFSGISEDGGLCIGQILQKARLVFDEEGTQAAAATVELIMPTSALAPETVVAFDMDRPFVAVIADAENGAVCFAAVINNPLG